MVIEAIGMAGVVFERKDGVAPVTVLCQENGCLNAPDVAGLPWDEAKLVLVRVLVNSGLRSGEEFDKALQDRDQLAVMFG